MIPIRDTIPHRSPPYVMYVLIAINALAFMNELALGPAQLQRFFLQYGIVPVRYSNPAIASHFGLADQMFPFISSMFLHGGWLHIIGNMWVLWIFGDNVEDWFGHTKFALFYLFCGVASAILHLAFNWDSQLPTVGASGAIAGVMGAYFILFPGARILTLLPIFLFFTFVELPAWVFLGLWFLIQFLSGTASAGMGAAGGIAWWAHVGGFAVGALVVLLLGRGTPRRSEDRAARPAPWDKVDEYW